jgi:hypothetical protein
MGYNPDAVLARDQHRCRLRFIDCTKDATRIVLNIAEWLGGGVNDGNALSACKSCAKEHLRQRERAEELFYR